MESLGRVLIVDDEPHEREALAELIATWGYESKGAASGEEALSVIASFDPRVVISDLRMPGLSGMELLQRVTQSNPDLDFIMLTGQGSFEEAVEATKLGAYNFLEKPINPSRLQVELRNCVQRHDSLRQLEVARRRLREAGVLGKLVGRSKAIQEVMAVVSQVAPSRAHVLITGESGTGKELVARTLHDLSPRQSRSFVAINCAAIPETLMESEIFGHEKGAFTGAVERRVGCFELADGGTLLLDEIGEMPLPTQAKLLRVIEDCKLRRLGSKSEITVDVRVLAATNKVPEDAVAKGQLRSDLYYRLNVVRIAMPPLRARLEDLEELVQALLADLNRKHQRSVRGVDEGALEAFRRYSWPGNVRELRNTLERMIVLSSGDILRQRDMPSDFGNLRPPHEEDELRLRPGMTVEEAERKLIVETLAFTSHNKTRAAAMLGISLKAKLTAAISLLVLLVVLAISAVYLSRLTRQALVEVGHKGEDLAHEVYEQARSVLSHSELPPGVNPNNSEQVLAFVQSRLAQNAGLNALLNSAVGYSATIYDVAITDARGRVLVANDPAEIGTRYRQPPPFRSLLEAGTLHQIEVIYGRPRVYEVNLPVSLGAELLTVRVGLSTIFLRQELSPELRRGMALAGLAILIATLTASLLSFRLLRPLETISQSVDQMAQGKETEPLRLDRRDEWGFLSSRLNLLGEQIRGEKSAYQRLKDNLDQLLSNLNEGLLLFDRDDRLVLATPTATQFLRCSSEALMQRPVREVFGSDRELDQAIRKAFEYRQPSLWPSLSIEGLKGINRVMASVQFAVRDGERVGTLVTLRDASRRAELASDLDETAKMAALSRIMSGVAHEVKNPLNAMALQIELLRSKLADHGAPVKAQLGILSEEIQRLDRVVKTFLDFTHPLELHRAPTDLSALIRDVFILAEPHARSNQVRLTLDANGDLPRIFADPALLKQAFLNLVLNACQAMPAGGELKVSSRLRDHWVEIDVADQGTGIPVNLQQRIFQLFFTTKPGGSGIGLAMTYRIIQLHSGTIDFTSEPGRGTTFHISLPANINESKATG